ncbi:doublecortin domain-containing protein 2C [Rhineura floridana]|uniref:doublecortin domain-containing protein 2C n=1 Tax=Rhineura floridana TaxID=261503 RepID=UPI002AC883AA|nr:doublecortin domain-containing protein 2C [Rhineura floridana]
MVGATRLRAVYSLTDATPARTIWVYRNGDPYYLGRKFVINHRYVPNFEALMIQLNEGVPTPFGVRNIYTPRQGHSVMDLSNFQQGGRYVVGGRERFRKLNYFNIGAKKPERKKRDEVIRPVVHSNIQVPSKWQSSGKKPLNINVFTNGDMLITPVKILIPKFTLKSWNGVLGLINEKVFSRSGGIHRLYTLNGQRVQGSNDFEHNQFYVGCGKERFQPMPYWQHPKVPEDIRRNFSNSDGPPEKPPPKKPPMEPSKREGSMQPPVQPSKREGSMQPPVQPSKREGSMQPPVQPSKRGAEDRTSVYYAKPEKANRDETPRHLTSDDGHGIYKAHEFPKEIEEAREIQEDKNVQVEIPVDQAPAEVVNDEDIYSNAGSIEEEAEEDYVDEKPEKKEKRGVFKKMFGFMFKSKKKDKKEDTQGGSTKGQDAKKTRMSYTEQNEYFDAYDYD